VWSPEWSPEFKLQHHHQKKKKKKKTPSSWLLSSSLAVGFPGLLGLGNFNFSSKSADEVFMCTCELGRPQASLQFQSEASHSATWATQRHQGLPTTLSKPLALSL
jgi:hypothetical protein